MQAVSFAGLGVPALSYWRWWQIGGTMDDSRTVAALGHLAEARRIATLHYLPERFVLTTPLPKAVDDPHNAMPAAILGFHLFKNARYGNRGATVAAIHTLRLLLQHDYFWIEVHHQRHDTHHVGIHLLPTEMQAAMDAFLRRKNG